METRPVHDTARSAAMLRALHLLVDGDPKIFRDELALPLSGVSREEALALWRTGSLPPTAGWVLRSRYVEDLLAEGDYRQYVLLGAGLDSFAHRRVRSLGALRVFEVDDPPMQERKRRRLRELGVDGPDGLFYAACDFETTAVGEALGRAGFDATAPSLVAWLGVTQYLTREATDATLAWAAGLARGSRLVLTHVVPGEEAETTRRRFAARGIAFETFFTPEEMEAVLRRAGFGEVVPLEAAEAETRYFRDRSDELHAPTGERLVSGIV